MKIITFEVIVKISTVANRLLKMHNI